MRSYGATVSISSHQREKNSETLRRILSAFALHNTTVGYCQSMNIITAFLHRVVSEEVCFWLLSALCHLILNVAFWACVLPGVFLAHTNPPLSSTGGDDRPFLEQPAVATGPVV